jgi:hypothetical protein
VEIFAKDFLNLHDSTREEKFLSSSDFVTAASMVQQSAKVESVTMNSGKRTDTAGRSSQFSQFAPVPWLIYTSHSLYRHYYTD